MIGFGEMTLLLVIGGLAFAPQPARWVATSFVGTTAPAIMMLAGTRDAMTVMEAPAAVAVPVKPARP